MGVVRIWIDYQPRLYREIFQQLLRYIDSVELVKDVEYFGSRVINENHDIVPQVDVIILSIEQTGRGPNDLLPKSFPNAKIIAFHPNGDYGLRHVPGEEDWEVIRPFNLDQLFQEVLDYQTVEK